MCDSLLTFRNIFPNSKNIHITLNDWPNSDFVGWFCINISSTLIFVLISLLYFTSLSNNGRLQTIQEKRFIPKIIFISTSIIISILSITWGWHSMDLLHHTVCSINISNCNCTFEQQLKETVMENTINILSWRPLFFCLSIIIPIVPIMLIFVNQTIFTLSFICLLPITLLLGILSFIFQRFCSYYSLNKCNTCPIYESGMISLCSIPFFELSIIVLMCWIVQILRIRKKSRVQTGLFNHKSTIGTELSNFKTEIIQPNFIDLPNNRQYNIHSSANDVVTTRDKWYSIVGY